nr:hypothetical protein [Tanacetum cinerariifolium]
MSAKRTSWNKFSSSMASAVISHSTSRKFNFSKAQVGDLSSYTTKYSSPALTQKVFANMRMVGKGFYRVNTPLFEGMLVAQQVDENAAEVNVDNVPTAGVADKGAANVNADVVLTDVDEPSIPSRTPPTQPPPPSQDLPSTLQVKKLERRDKLKVSKLRRLKKVGTAQRVDTSDDTIMDDVSKQGRIIASMDADLDVTLRDVVDIAKEVVVDAEIERSADDDEIEPAKLQELVEVVTTAKLITEVDDVIDQVQRKDKEDNVVMRYQALKRKPQTEAQAKKNMMIYLRNMAGFKIDYFKGMKYDDIRPIFEKYFNSNEVVVNAEIKESADVQGRQAESQAQIYQIDLEHADKVLSMQDDELEPTELQEVVAARRRKGVVIKNPKETATPSTIIHTEPKSKDNGKRILDDVIDLVHRKEKEDNVVMRYQALKRKPQTEAQARKNMMIYLRNMAGFKMDYFKGMKYDDIRPIFKKYFNYNVAFLEKTKEQMEEEDNRALKRANESQAEKAAKK